MFRDRAEGGRRLAERLAAYRGRADAAVRAVPRGGLVTGAALAGELGLPLDAVLVKKLGHPREPEYAVAAVGLEAVAVHEEAARALGLSPKWIEEGVRRVREQLERRREALYAGRAEPASAAGKTVLLVDDGAATGLTLAAAADVLKKAGAARVVAAVPVASPEAMELLGAHADEVLALYAPVDFHSVGRFYEDFAEVDDAAAAACLSGRSIS